MVTCNYKIIPMDISNYVILWLIELDNDQKSIVCSVRREVLVEGKNTGEKKVVHEKKNMKLLKPW